MPMIRKLITLRALWAAAVWAALATSATADPVTFTANTSATFASGACLSCSVDNNVVPTITSSGGGGLSAIAFVSSSPQFTAALDGGQSATVNLGQLTAASTVPSGTGPSFTGATFTLNVSFTAPGGTGPNPGVFTAALTGQLTQTNAGVQVNFNTTSVSFFSPTAGDFTLTVPASVVINAATNTTINGTLTFTTPIPEPATLLLLGTGLAGAAGWAKRRRRRNTHPDDADDQS